MDLTITSDSCTDAVLEAIKDAHNKNLQVIKLGLPLTWQEDIIDTSSGHFEKGDRLKELFGIPVVKTRVPQITLGLSRFKPL